MTSGQSGVGNGRYGDRDGGWLAQRGSLRSKGGRRPAAAEYGRGFEGYSVISNVKQPIRLFYKGVATLGGELEFAKAKPRASTCAWTPSPTRRWRWAKVDGSPPGDGGGYVVRSLMQQTEIQLAGKTYIVERLPVLPPRGGRRNTRRCKPVGEMAIAMGVRNPTPDTWRGWRSRGGLLIDLNHF